MSTPGLAEPLFLTLLGGGFTAAFLHAALPTHWLPFVLVARAQRWGLGQMLAAVVVAGFAHIVTTAVAGSLIVAAGLALNQWVAGLLPHLSAALLFLFGAFYLAKSSLRRPQLASGPQSELTEPGVSDRAAFLGLVAIMALSPGEVLLPIYLSAADEGLTLLALLTVCFLLGTLAGMVLLTLAVRAGASVLKVERWARYEGAVLGVALIILGLLVATHQH
jgi:hypothetical protein